MHIRSLEASYYLLVKTSDAMLLSLAGGGSFAYLGRETSSDAQALVLSLHSEFIPDSLWELYEVPGSEPR